MNTQAYCAVVRAEAVRRVAAGETYAQVAKATGIAHWTIAKWCRAAGVRSHRARS